MNLRAALSLMLVLPGSCLVLAHAGEPPSLEHAGTAQFWHAAPGLAPAWSGEPWLAAAGAAGVPGAESSRPWEWADQGGAAGLPSNWYFCNGCSSHVHATLSSPSRDPAHKAADPSALLLIALALLTGAAMRRRVF